MSSAAALAQQKLLSGYLKDSLTHLPIAGGTVSNPDKKQKVPTDGNGFFRLAVSPGDLLYLLAPHYNLDTLRFAGIFQDTVTLFLSPQNVLEAVTVETGYQRYRLDSAERRMEFEAARGRTLNAIDRSNRKPYFGLTLNLDRLFKRRYQNKQKDEQTFQKTEDFQYTNFRFSPQVVAFYTGLKGNELLLFMNRYTPSVQWLRAHPAREQVIDYISTKWKEYRNGLPAKKANGNTYPNL